MGLNIESLPDLSALRIVRAIDFTPHEGDLTMPRLSEADDRGR